MKKLLFLLSYFPLISSPTLAQNRAKMETQYFNLYVMFGSECCGIDRQAFDELNNYVKKFQKKNAKKLKSETLRWGKEGERVLYFETSQLTDNQADEFTNKVLKMFANKQYKLVKTGLLLHYQIAQKTLWVHCIPYDINQKREKDFLQYVEKFETENQVIFFKGSMINETGIEEDQDKRYELNLNALSEEKRTEFIKQVKIIFSINENED